MRPRRRQYAGVALAIGLVLSLLALAPLVHGAEPTAAEKERARSLLDEGDHLFEQKDYPGALSPDANTVFWYSIDAVSGALTNPGQAATEAGPRSVAVHPTGKFVYVTLSAVDQLAAYAIDAATGALTHMPPC